MLKELEEMKIIFKACYTKLTHFQKNYSAKENSDRAIFY